MKKLLFVFLTATLYASAAQDAQPQQITSNTTYSAPAVPSKGELVIPVVTDELFNGIISDIQSDTSPMEALLSFIVCLSKTTTAAQTNAVNFYNNLTPAQRNNQLSDISNAEDLKNTIAPTFWAIYQQLSNNQKQLFFTATIETVSNREMPETSSTTILSGVGTPTSVTTN